MRGGERVLEHLCRAYPDAPILTLLANPAAVSDEIRRHPIQTSFLQSIPGIHRRYRYLLPLFPAAVRSLRVPPCDLVISTSHCAIKSVRPPPGARHLCYCFTPMRYAWQFYAEYFGRNPVKALAAKPLLAWLRRWDRRTSQRVDRFVAISRHVADRIRRAYGREPDVVYPPVETDYWTPGPGPVAEVGAYDLIVSALVPYKRVDLAVGAWARSGQKLKVVGTGTEAANLQRVAGPNVEFLGWQTDEAIRDLYRGCRMLVFPGEEDFGIVPLEAQACGRPVVAYRAGGAMETVLEGETGVFFGRQDEESLLAAARECASRPWNPPLIRRHAETFAPSRFMAGLTASVERCLMPGQA
jgi:glycosyltransferase involved in cell wall biosynthesis